jgi:small subunit ribosomal protein S10
VVEATRVLLTSRSKEAIDGLCAEIRRVAMDEGIAMSGPIPLPTKRLRVPVRKGPDGCGSSSIDHWEMRIHRRLIDIDTDPRVLRYIVRLNLPDGVEIVITMV